MDTTDEDQRFILLLIICFVLSLTIPTFGIRIYVRVFVRKMFTIDDWMMVITSILHAGFISCMTVAACNGLGAHTANLKAVLRYGVLGTAHQGDVVVALQFFYLSTLLYVLAFLFLRISIAFYLARKVDFYSYRPLVMITLAISTIASFAFFFSLLFQCSPITDYWSRVRSNFPGACSQGLMTSLWYAFLGVSLAADLILSAFAVAAMCERDMRWSRRLMLVPVNVFAALSIASCATQFVYVPRLEQYEDLTWAATPFAIFFLITPSAGTVAANLTTYGPWLKEISLFTTQPSFNMTFQAARRPTAAAAAAMAQHDAAMPPSRPWARPRDRGSCVGPDDVEWAGSPTQRLSSISI
ncbi:uncharacterized protein J3D65DRAFT_200590 [Phyllosticta citribraziliensis]|uniref:Rhodopsin domain-containing protein n=1 Tax=Phyllosticta citribraziliensis TaxID=989973 RepID=A0ABR1M3C9_9PEZI